MKVHVLASEGFQSALNKLLAAELPLKTAFKLKKFVGAIQEDLKTFEELRSKVFQEFGTKDENGEVIVKDGMITLDPALADQWQPKLLDLQELEAEAKLELKLDDLGDKVELSAADLMALDGVLSE